MPRTAAKKSLFFPGEEYIEEKNRVRRESLLYPWDEVAFHIMKLISFEGILSVVYGYHFRLLNELIFQGELPLEKRLSIPHFLLNSIIDMRKK